MIDNSDGSWTIPITILVVLIVGFFILVAHVGLAKAIMFVAISWAAIWILFLLLLRLF